MEKQKELTIRQTKLLNLLKERYAEDPTKWISSKEIYMAFQNDESDNYNESPMKDARKGINEDYHAINDDTTVPNIVITSRNKGYKLASKEEMDEYFNRNAKSLRKAFGRLYGCAKKAGKDGQMDLFDETFRKAFSVDLGNREEAR